jgi:ParB-like chromosome segregation protein Spo0J
LSEQDYHHAHRKRYSIINSRPLNNIKSDRLEALEYSIEKYGLLNPLCVAPIPKNLEAPNVTHRYHILEYKYYSSGACFIIDGQRRYLAIKNMLQLRNPCEIENEVDERHQGEICTDASMTAWAKEKLKETKEDKVLIPCLIYNYGTTKQMLRHSLEDNYFSIKPESRYLDMAERIWG